MQSHVDGEAKTVFAAAKKKGRTGGAPALKSREAQRSKRHPLIPLSKHLPDLNGTAEGPARLREKTGKTQTPHSVLEARGGAPCETAMTSSH